jgi:hypothetical protein
MAHSGGRTWEDSLVCGSSIFGLRAFGRAQAARTLEVVLGSFFLKWDNQT